MLDRATVDRLARAPEQNAPLLNVALAEEGTAEALRSLLRSPALGPEAIAVIGARVAREGERVGLDPEAHEAPAAADLDRLLVSHPNAPDEVRDAALARHAGEAFFVLAAASHPRATARAVEQAADWPAATAAHDRPWLALLPAAAIAEAEIRLWSNDSRPLRREAAAVLATDAALLLALARDPARRVRRAVAASACAVEARAALREDPAPDVRARARAEPAPRPASAGVDSARFATALAAMAEGGVLAPDVVEALANAADLDAEGALLAGLVLPRAALCARIQRDAEGARAPWLAAGLAQRAPAEDHAALVQDAVRALGRAATDDRVLSGRARLSAWTAAGLAQAEDLDHARLMAHLARRPLAAERMILRRATALQPALVGALVRAAGPGMEVPPALIELAFSDREVPDARVIELSARVTRPRERGEDLPEDELDLDPEARPIEVLERAVLAASARADVSARAAFVVVALDARRVRYVLSAMPEWRGHLGGAKLSRVLRRNAGAITVAQAEARGRAARVESWTERRLTELELAIALAVGHVTGAEAARRIASGRQPLGRGIDLAFAAEARAALEGAASVEPLLAWADARYREIPAALAIWLVLERFDRERAPALVASALDTSEHEPAVADPVCEALSVLERRRPGRLAAIHPHTPRGRAAIASAIARAYRAVGGLPHTRRKPPAARAT